MSIADRKPNSTFGKVMRWHRKWCPAWVAHTKVYGDSPLILNVRLSRLKGF